MAFDIASASTVAEDADLVGFALVEGFEGAELYGLDPAWLETAGFQAKAGQSYAAKVNGRTIIALGLGAVEKLDTDSVRRVGAALARAGSKATKGVLVLPWDSLNIPAADASQAAAEGMLLGSYKYTDFKTSSETPKLQQVTVVGADDNGLRAGSRVAEAVKLARDLVNAPPGVSTPKRLAAVATEVAEAHDLDIKILDEHDIEREGLGGLRGVSMGSDEPPRLVELTYTPAGDPVATIALVGKGITFDSGGLSLKPPAGMMTMKTDMSGAAAVIAAMSVIGATRPNVKVIGIIAATENLPGPKATKPGDVLKARNGKTMEVLNTDAEGRLVLADGLSLAVEAGVDAIIDLATLTGACVTALGGEIAGLMTNNEEFGDRVRAAADSAAEPVWPLPLPQRYRKHIDSDIADIKNIGAPGGAAGTLTAGLFLKEFVGDTPWVHLDIAGPARADGDDAYITKGATGFGVRTLIELVKSYA